MQSTNRRALMVCRSFLAPTAPLPLLPLLAAAAVEGAAVLPMPLPLLLLPEWALPPGAAPSPLPLPLWDPLRFCTDVKSSGSMRSWGRSAEGRLASPTVAGAEAPVPDSLRAARAGFGTRAGQGAEAVHKPAAVRDGRAAAGARLCGVQATKSPDTWLFQQLIPFRFPCC